MKKLFLQVILIIIIASCTKEVPEAEKRLTKSVNEKEIRELFNQFVNDYNSGNFDQSLRIFSSDFSGYIPDSDSGLDVRTYKNNFINFIKQHSDGKIQLNIEDIFAADDQCAVQTFTSYMAFDPVEKKMNPIYSERSIYLLRKNKTDGWKIFRSLSAAAFSYD